MPLIVVVYFELSIPCVLAYSSLNTGIFLTDSKLYFYYTLLRYVFMLLFLKSRLAIDYFLIFYSLYWLGFFGPARPEANLFSSPFFLLLSSTELMFI